MVSNSIIVVL